MKKLFVTLMTCVYILGCVFGICACDSTDEETETPSGTLQQIEGATLADGEFTYDGQPHSLTVTGAPNGVQISYENNGKTEVGVYTVKATLTKQGYEDKILTATLTIKKPKIEGATLADGEFTYDGQPHSLTVTGAPNGVQISYENNGKTDAGVYTVKATLTKEGYEDKILTATLTIDKAEFVGVKFEDKKFVYFGKTCSLAVDETTTPEGTVVTYTNNDKVEVGEYEVTATLTNPNYVTKQLKATLTITAKKVIALSIVNSLLDKPDPWSFLPEVFVPENMAYTQLPVSGLEGFAVDTQVSLIAKKSIGKQFYVLYEGLQDAASAIRKIDLIFEIGDTIASAYQTFLNNNPDNYAEFTKEIGGFQIKILLDGERSRLLAGNSTVNIELDYDGESGVRTGRLQLTNGIAVKYTSSENALKLGVKTTVNDIGNLKQIEFVRTGNSVAGYLREFTGTETKNLKTTAAIASNATKTVIMSNKRESDDLLINGYEEVYSSVTGEMIGGRVQETIAKIDYDTLWLHLGDVRGFESIRVSDEANGRNQDSIFVNGQTTLFATKNVTPINPLSSRRFDIEMKEVRYVVAEVVDNKTEYKLVKTSIPMLFVQTDQTGLFASDVKEKNSYVTNASLPTAKIATVNADFETLQALFEAAKEQITFADIQSFIGTKDAFFETETQN